MRSGRVLLALAAALATVACATTNPPVPIDMEEVVDLASHGPDDPAFLDALQARPIGFPLTCGAIDEMQARGMTEETIDAVIESTVHRRARDLAPRYGYHQPYFHSWPFVWYYDIGWYRFRRY